MLNILNKETMFESDNYVSIKNSIINIKMKGEIISYGEKKGKASILKGMLDSFTVTIIPHYPNGNAVLLIAFGKNNNFNKNNYMDMDEKIVRCAQDVSTKIVRVLFNPDIEANDDRIKMLVSFMKEKISKVLDVKGMYVKENENIDEIIENFFLTNISTKLFDLE